MVLKTLIRLIVLVIISVLNTGCFFIFPLSIFQQTPEKAFIKANSELEKQPNNKAMAVVKSTSFWVWGASWNLATEDQARANALLACNNKAKEEGIIDACRLYSVNGKVIY